MNMYGVKQYKIKQKYELLNYKYVLNIQKSLKHTKYTKYSKCFW